MSSTVLRPGPVQAAADRVVVMGGGEVDIDLITRPALGDADQGLEGRWVGVGWQAQSAR